MQKLKFNFIPLFLLLQLFQFWFNEKYKIIYLLQI